MEKEGNAMSVNDDLRVMTYEQLRRSNENAAAASLESLSASVISLARPDSYNIARVSQVAHDGPRLYYRVIAVIELAGDTDWHEVTFDVLPEDWRALPTIREFDERLDRVEAALARAELPGAPLAEVLR
jgi:hypothetical protein